MDDQLVDDTTYAELELQRRKALWLRDSERHRHAEPRIDYLKSFLDEYAQKPYQPAERPFVADRRICTKCGRRGDLEPALTVSPCCKVHVVVSDYRGQVRLRERLWEAAITKLNHADSRAADRTYQKQRKAWRQGNKKALKRARAGKFGL